MPANARLIAALAAGLYLLTSLAPAQAISAREKDFEDWRLRCELKSDHDHDRCFFLQIAKTL